MKLRTKKTRKAPTPTPSPSPSPSQAVLEAIVRRSLSHAGPIVLARTDFEAYLRAKRITSWRYGAAELYHTDGRRIELRPGDEQGQGEYTLA